MDSGFACPIGLEKILVDENRPGGGGGHRGSSPARSEGGSLLAKGVTGRHQNGYAMLG